MIAHLMREGAAVKEISRFPSAWSHPPALAPMRVGGQETGMAARVDALASTRSQPIAAEIAGTRLLILDDGPERLKALLALIDAARSSVRLLFYMFAGDASGEAVRDALVRAVGRGVDVKLVIDGFGCSNGIANFFAPLTNAGGAFCLFHPSYGRRYLLRNHQKMAIADDRVAIVGGANIADDYFSAHSDSRWRDLWLRLEGAAVKPLTRYYDAIFGWTTTKGARIRDLRRIIHRHSQHRGALQWRYAGPMRVRNPWPSKLAKEIICGEQVDMIAAYFSPPFAMLRRLARLGRRGRVRIITAARSDNNATIAAARHTYARLLRNGVEMYEYQAEKLHTKLVIVDDVVHIGSSNFDFRSLYLNLENMLRIEDAAFAARMRRYFEGELQGSLRITPELHKRRANVLRRLKWTLSHFLVTSMDYTVTRRLNFGAEK
ncbi:phosphatidylserine/phosphatidylglycerophosphate/cardiolipin synthase family protein [Sphingomonas sp. GCM10030256]|uniref:phospholipase D-like domain-containing protein n=1 Tax=Sphingomonas sp. GCM10030256 TaxID=3273427 RepID=UPI00360923E8